MRWVFIRPCHYSNYYDPEVQEPLGLEYLAASRRVRGDAVLILDSVLDNIDDRRLARRAASFCPDFIGFSLTTATQIASTIKIFKECERCLAGHVVLWVAGGNFVTTEPRQALEKLPSSFLLVRSEGERALDEIASLWGGALTDVTLKDRSRIFQADVVKSVDDLPFPVRPYAEQTRANGSAFNIQGSRGCCGNCRYCASPAMAGASNRWRGRSVENIVDEISELCSRYRLRSFNFIDEDFLGPDAASFDRARKFAEQLRIRKLKISFSIQVRPGTLDEETIKLLAEAGLVYVFMGVESDDPNDFKRWGRPYNKGAWGLVDLLRNYGVEVNVGVLLFHPHATFSGIRRFARKLERCCLLEYRSATNRMDAMPGSCFYNQAMESGIFNAEVLGPQVLPFLYKGIEQFHLDLLHVLAPLGPTSMQAICSLPPLLTQVKFKNGLTLKRDKLKSIIKFLDKTVASAFFSVLDFHEHGEDDPNILTGLRERNLEYSVEAANILFVEGLAPSFEDLRQAIWLDSGL